MNSEYVISVHIPADCVYCACLLIFSANLLMYKTVKPLTPLSTLRDSVTRFKILIFG